MDRGDVRTRRRAASFATLLAERTHAGSAVARVAGDAAARNARNAFARRSPATDRVLTRIWQRW
jgi:hypothetical protein